MLLCFVEITFTTTSRQTFSQVSWSLFNMTRLELWSEAFWSTLVLTLFTSSGCSVDQRPVCVDAGSLTDSRGRDYFTAEHFDVRPSAFLMSLPVTSLHHGPFPQQRDRRPSIEEVEVVDCGGRPDRPPPYNTFMGTFLLTATFF